MIKRSFNQIVKPDIESLITNEVPLGLQMDYKQGPYLVVAPLHRLLVRRRRPVRAP